jgi:hypothetical protein
MHSTTGTHRRAEKNKAENLGSHSEVVNAKFKKKRDPNKSGADAPDLAKATAGSF